MPTSCKKDTKGCYCQWGSKSKYYYKCGDKSARARARSKANKQGAAAHAHGYKGSESNIADVISKLKVINKILRKELKK